MIFFLSGYYEIATILTTISGLIPMPLFLCHFFDSLNPGDSL